MKNLVIVNAGLGDPSTTRQVAERVGDAVVRRVTAAGEGLEVRRIDLRDLAADLATYMTTYIPSEALDRARRTVSAADGLIVATPVFQGSYSGLFKMFFDTLEMRSLEEVPVTMVATAGLPGIRWCSTTRYGRCCRSSTPWCCRPECSRTPPNSVRTADCPPVSSGPRANSPANSRLSGESAGSRVTVVHRTGQPPPESPGIPVRWRGRRCRGTEGRTSASRKVVSPPCSPVTAAPDLQ